MNNRAQFKEKFLTESQKDTLFIMDLIENTLGGECYKSTPEEDMLLHVDLWWNSPKKGKIGIDAKGIKKDAMKNYQKNDNINWIETIGISGYRGWIYGKSEYIAFRRFNSVVFCKTSKLRELTENHNIKDKQIVLKRPTEFYVPYRREGNLDVIYKVPTDILIENSHFIIEH